MRVITSIQGSVALKYSPDESAPEPAVLTRDVVSFIGIEYNFSVTPQVQPGLLLNPVLTFQTGELVTDAGKIPINQLTWAPQVAGLILTARDTDTAETVLAAMVSKLDEQFRFKIAKATKAKYYQSNLTVEFDPALEQQLPVLQRIQRLLEKEIPREDQSFAIKRLGFGNLSVERHGGIMAQIEDIQDTDFVIERRAIEPLSENRYFCIAPTTTREHERILALVERTLRD
jgi:hypothetical protein